MQLSDILGSGSVNWEVYQHTFTANTTLDYANGMYQELVPDADTYDVTLPSMTSDPQFMVLINTSDYFFYVEFDDSDKFKVTSGMVLYCFWTGTKWVKSEGELSDIIEIIDGNNLSCVGNTVFSTKHAGYVSIAKLDDNIFVCVFENNYTNGQAFIFSISNNTFTLGSKYTFFNDKLDNVKCSKIDSSRFLITYSDRQSSYEARAIIGIRSDYNISFGSIYTFHSQASNISSCVMNDSEFIAGYLDDSNSYKLNYKICTISNEDEISFGSAYPITYASTVGNFIIEKATEDTFVALWTRSSAYLSSSINTISNNTITIGAENTSIPPYQSSDYYRLCVLNSSTFLITLSAQASPYEGKILVGSISGTNISYGSTYQFNGSARAESNDITRLLDDSAILFYVDNGNSDYMTLRVAHINGTTISFDNKKICSNYAYVPGIFSDTSASAILLTADSVNSYPCLNKIMG